MIALLLQASGHSRAVGRDAGNGSHDRMNLHATLELTQERRTSRVLSAARSSCEAIILGQCRTMVPSLCSSLRICNNFFVLF